MAIVFIQHNSLPGSWKVSNITSKAAFKALYAKGVVDDYSLIHGTYWPSAHKFVEAFQWHRWHINRFDQERGWNANRTIPVWEPPEWLTSIIQTSEIYGQLVTRIGYTAHFKIHLHVGGFHGDLSNIWATNDPIFYPLHAHVADLALLKWQLANDSNLVPQSYNRGANLDWRTGRVFQANVETDHLTHFEEITVKETFQVGFGELCYIHDQLVQPILDIIANRPPKLPAGALTLQRQLPAQVFDQYFPKFASKSGTYFEHFMPDLRMNNKFTPVCDEMPIALSFNSTPTGRRLLEQLRTEGGVDNRPRAFDSEDQYYGFMNALNKYHYCSPYLQTRSQHFMR
ncbi:unnamed protein product [Medioppia subpectinata]|uniref:Tyrosinase copper-binding domain-containing protein n=1 Tax=Medioppia subpectinata TaxID=1979941 RepID=A0A7R9PZY0_9ACAR|nr:unnamed protein product [Medioppia subpectinata]CAG2106626.1 unnamed protein product [Medioppia subpectinata]